MVIKKPRIRLPAEFYKWSWRLVPATWVCIEWLAINEDDPDHTWTAYTRPAIKEEPLLKAAFVCFVAWVVKHYLIDGGKS